MPIQAVFIDPPIAIARLGGSTSPQEAFVWVQSPNPRADGETAVVPTWTLRVLPDATVEPHKPSDLNFRDGPLIRPVCPFFELHALVGAAGSAESTWQPVPLTPALLAQEGVDPSAITVRVNAQNLKAARRTGNRNHGFGTHPPLEIRANSNAPVAISAVSPPGAQPPMIPPGRNIPLGSIQIMQSQPQPTDREWSAVVNVEVIRFRFTPARGHFYGPPVAAQTTAQRPFPAVEAGNDFLDAQAGWFGAVESGAVEPGDTYDGAEANDGRSLGVVDDTCEARIEVSLALPNAPRPLRARANIFVAPPDFGPDRRPFLSLADELNDRSGDAAIRSAAMSTAELNAWVEDLFERIYETVSLLNVDNYRREHGLVLSGGRLGPPIPGDTTLEPTRALGGRDALRNQIFPVAGPTPNDPLPLSHHARMRHRALSDLQNLRGLLLQTPGRLRALVRRPFEVEAGEGPRRTTMRMPPFMAQSNLQPLTLAAWQYDLLMDWASNLAPMLVAPVQPMAAPAISAAATRRQANVLARLDAVAAGGNAADGGGNTGGGSIE
jgi:hypothetical protein